MKTKLSGGKPKSIRENLGYANRFEIDSQGRSGSLFVIWNNGWDVTLQRYSKDHKDPIDVLVKNDVNEVWRFIGIYGRAQAQMANSYGN